MNYNIASFLSGYIEKVYSLKPNLNKKILHKEYLVVLKQVIFL